MCVCFYLNVCSFLKHRFVYVSTVGLDLTGKYINATLMPSRIYNSLGRGAVVREVRRNKNATLKLSWVKRNQLDATYFIILFNAHSISGIKLVSLYSTIKMMHGPINIRFEAKVCYSSRLTTCHFNRKGEGRGEQRRSVSDILTST